MELLFGFSFFAFGTLIGSFLNVVLLRFESGRSLGGRSQCLSCGTTLGALELVPILSYAALGGKCFSCKSRISFQYPLVEILTGSLFFCVYLLHAPLLETLWILSLMPFVVLIAVYDLRHTLIPDAFAYPFLMLAAFPPLAQAYEVGMLSPLLVLLSGPLLALPLFVLWFFSRGSWMGLGDVKLALGMGFALGFEKGIAALLLSFWMGALVGVVLLIAPKIAAVFKRSPLFSAKKHFTMKSEIPFAPFLLLGFLVVLFFRFDYEFLASLFTRYIP